MKKEELKRWLEAARLDAGTVGTYISKCNTICRCEGDIDEHFANDECSELLEQFVYSTNDLRHDVPLRHSIPIAGNKYNGTMAYKKVLNLYIKFLKGETYEANTTGRATTRETRLWPVWEMPSDDECYMLAQASTKYLKFLSPEIVEAVVRDNEDNREMFCDYLSEAGIDPELYLWEGSSCCFPGIRRYAGSAEISAHRGHARIDAIEDAIALDDNDFPKHIWSFVFRGQQFGKFGPKGYSLAHLVDHKKDQNRMPDEFDFARGYEYQKPFYGLYSCPSNTVYTPANLIRLTDFNTDIRNMLFRKVESLYKDVCNIVPSYAKVKEARAPRWELDEFEWTAPVGTMDNVAAFLLDRQRKIIKKLEKWRQRRTRQ